ncbi:MAG: site-specific DNA-methyltransferase [Chloroflexi bacterium]|nr:site-specific DNA-methyltransferase [Chloroflexota bacterium]
MNNQILHGDCLFVLKKFPANYVDLVYLDPPFFTQSKLTLKSRALREYSFIDNWDSIESYLDFLSLRLYEIRRVMKENSTIFFHCDRNASHRIRVLLDEVFGYKRFVSEIIWTYRRWSTSTRSLLGSHQTIFMYAKTANYTFNEMYQDYSETTNLDQILQRRERDQHGKSVYVTDSKGRTVLNGPKKGVPMSDTWEIPYLNPKARERCGYPTQKPLQLLERIILLASNEDELILDPFCGSGTTLVAAKLLNRNFVGIDSSSEAVELSNQRIQNPIRSESKLLQVGRDAYKNLPENVVDILSALPVKLVQRNSGIDAIYDHFVNGKPIVLRVQRTGEDLTDAAKKLQRAGRKKEAAFLILIRTEQVNQQKTFVDVFPDDVQVVDSLAVSIQSSLENLIQDRVGCQTFVK